MTTPTAEERARQMEALATATDGADMMTVLAEVARCASSWEPEVRLLGNVRAGDIVRAISAAMPALRQAAEAARAVPVGYTSKGYLAECHPEAAGVITRECTGRWSEAVYTHPVPASAGVAEGLEMAAKIADAMYGQGENFPYDGGAGSLGFDVATQKIVEAIRAKVAALKGDTNG